MSLPGPDEGSCASETCAVPRPAGCSRISRGFAVLLRLQPDTPDNTLREATSSYLQRMHGHVGQMRRLYYITTGHPA